MAVEHTRQRAIDPSTPIDELAEIARESIQLRRYVFANPSCTPAIAKWIELESPSEAEAGRRLLQAEAEKVQPQPRASREANAAAQGAMEDTSLRTDIAAFSFEKPTPVVSAEKEKRGCLSFIVAVVMVYVLVQATIAIAALYGSDTSAGTSHNNSTSATSSTTETPAPEPAVVEDAYILIDTPSKNLSCEIHDDYVGCSIAERHYGEMGLPDCTGRLFSIVVDKGSVYERCESEFLGKVGDDVIELQYGEAITSANGAFTCSLSESGMTCENNSIGRGFKIARREQTRF